ncbi:hypothetical protein QZH41_020136, partial [Actinostola sp. cb2023]
SINSPFSGLTECVQIGESETERSYQFDGKVSWFVCFCSSLATSVILGCLYIFGILFPRILDEFRAGKAKTEFQRENTLIQLQFCYSLLTLAMVASLAMAFFTFLCVVAAKLCLRYGSRVVMVCAALTCALGLLGSAFAPNLYVLYVTYGCVVGFSNAMAYMAGFHIVPLYFDKHQSLATAIVSVGPGSGVLLMSPVTQALLEHLDWRKTLMVLAAINVVPCILACSITRRSTKPGLINEESDSKPIVPSNKECCSSLRSLDLSLFKDPVFMILSLTMSIAACGHLMPLVHLVKYAEELGIPGHRSSWMYFAMGFSSIVCRLLTGLLCNTGRVPLLRIFQCGALFFAATDCLLPFATNLTLLVLYSVSFGIGEGLYTTPLYCIMTKCYAGMGFGLFISFNVVPVFVGPVVAGKILAT